MSRSLKQRLGMLVACVWGGGTLAVVSGDGSVGWYVGIGVLLGGCLIFYLLMRSAPPADEE